MAKANRKGRSIGGGRFVALHHYMMETAAWRSLTPTDRAVYVELASLYDGKNNGGLALSTRDAARRCNIHKDTVRKSFARLQERGFIETATPGGFSRKTPHAGEWRLTSYRCDVTGTPHSKAFLRWRPLSLDLGQSKKNSGPKRRPPLSLETGQSKPESASTVLNEGTVNPSEPGSAVLNEGPHIHLRHRPPSQTKHGVGASDGAKHHQPKQPDPSDSVGPADPSSDDADAAAFD